MVRLEEGVGDWGRAGDDSSFSVQNTVLFCLDRRQIGSTEPALDVTRDAAVRGYSHAVVDRRSAECILYLIVNEVALWPLPVTAQGEQPGPPVH